MTQTHTLTPAAAAPVSTFRVAIVGATGYAGQELVRLLARHPRAASRRRPDRRPTSTPRRLPALARIWDGEVVPLDLQSVRAAADSCSWPCPRPRRPTPPRRCSPPAPA